MRFFPRWTPTLTRRTALAAATLLVGTAAETRVDPQTFASAVRIPTEAIQSAPNPETLALRVTASGIRTAFVPVWRGGMPFDGDESSHPGVMELKPLRDALHDRDVRFFAVCPIFQDCTEGGEKRRPELTPVDRTGDPWSGDGLPVNPLDAEFRAERIAWLVEVAQILRPDAIVLDDVAWPNVWDTLKGDPSRWPADHALYDFSDRAVEAFLKAAALTVPEYASDPVARNKWILGLHQSEWVRWRCETLATFPGEAIEAVRKVAPDMKFYLSVVPYPGDLGKLIAGQDLELLGKAVDGIIVTAHHERIERGRHWVKQTTEKARELSSKPVWMELESTLTGRAGYDAIEDLEAVVDLAIEGGAEGIVFSDWRAFEKGKDANAERKRKLVYGYFR